VDITGSKGCESVIVSLGAAGALAVKSGEYERVIAPWIPVRSRIGAGNSMVASVTLSLALGNTFAEALQFGVAAGTAAVMIHGTELCRWDDVLSLYDKMIEKHI
jgi:6-phosphofructokinase 2